ncbi:amine dehydrogenase large subunit [Mangrovicoccus sp. HB161399]|uniref:amine dehydrogenase large subunit n=1 Tax=Mangrovicoccus sp. HB161399 TaxID=2720392 RepID=UPI0015529790|nr:amine dehydrogenase large subunit [Mangrovicoccus sp. HB161399]
MKATYAVTLASAVAAGQAMAQDSTAEFVPETLTIEETISEGPNVFVMDQAWAGPSKVDVLGADDFAVKGNMGPGTTAQMALSKDGGTLYTTSVYMERYTYGPVTVVMHEWDVPTLSVRREFEISNRLAHVESQPALLSLTADEGYLLAQNATPATSITVVDLAAGTQLAEIPTPGCWGAFPAVEGLKFTTICGDGTLASYSFAADGSFGDPAKSEKIFDVDEDALFTNGVRIGSELVFVSFNGNLYFVDDSGEAPVLTGTAPLTEGVLGRWAPSGSELIAYNAPTDTAFVLMHSDTYDGSHKNPATEIWSIDMETKTVVGRSPAHHENGLAVTQTEEPILYGATEEGNVVRYDVTMGDEVSLAMAEEFETGAGFVTLLKLDR